MKQVCLILVKECAFFKDGFDEGALV